MTDIIEEIIEVSATEQTTEVLLVESPIPVVGSGAQLGETEDTAHRGDHGVIAYNHSQTIGNPHGTATEDIDGLAGRLADIDATIVNNNNAINASLDATNDRIDSANQNIDEITLQLDDKFDTPTGTTSEYITGDGTLAPFPVIPAAPTLGSLGAEPAIAPGTATQYWGGDKTWKPFNPAVIGSVLTGFVVGSPSGIAATDSVLVAFQKLQAIANESNSLISAQQGIIDQQSATVSSLQTTVSQQSTTISGLQTTVSQQSTTITTLQTTVTTQQATIDEQAATITDLETRARITKIMAFAFPSVDLIPYPIYPVVEAPIIIEGIDIFVGAGGASCELRINGVAVAGCAPMGVSTVSATFTATGSNTAGVGAKIELLVTSSTATMLQGVLRFRYQ